MKLYLVGHDYRFAIEEGVLVHLGMKPDSVELRGKPPARGDNQIVSRLSVNATGLATCSATIRFGGRSMSGVSRANTAGLSDYDRKNVVSHALKIALAKAAARLADSASPWGSLSGMRPSKLAMKLIEERGASKAFDSLTRRYLVSADRAKLALDCAAHGVELKQKLKPNQIALYIGIPFCPSRCAYCSFVSHTTAKEDGLIASYLDTLVEEIERRGALVREIGLEVTTLYVGGGTPTILEEKQLERLLGAIEKSFDLSFLREYTVEAGRPDTITSAKLDVLKRHGVHRISVNPQSMDDEVLVCAARPHTGEDVETVFKMARQAGLAINMDLIAGLGGDTTDRFSASLERIIALEPENITIHTLARKRGSDLSREFAEGAAAVSDSIPEMLEFAFGALPAKGYKPYYLYRQKYTSEPGNASVGENTGWTTDGHVCEYNVATMEELQSVLALGAGGITKLVRDGKVSRLSNGKHPREYIHNFATHLVHDELFKRFFMGELPKPNQIP